MNFEKFSKNEENHVYSKDLKKSSSPNSAQATQRIALNDLTSNLMCNAGSVSTGSTTSRNSIASSDDLLQNTSSSNNSTTTLVSETNSLDIKQRSTSSLVHNYVQDTFEDRFDDEFEDGSHEQNFYETNSETINFAEIQRQQQQQQQQQQHLLSLEEVAEAQQRLDSVDEYDVEYEDNSDEYEEDTTEEEDDEGFEEEFEEFDHEQEQHVAVESQQSSRFTRDEETAYSTQSVDSEYAEALSETSDCSDSVFVPPKPFEIKRSRKIDQELYKIYEAFHSDTLDPNDEDTYDATMVAEYSPEIFNYMHELELRLRPDPLYMEHQDELKWQMRATLVDWLVQVHSGFNLFPETLYLCVNYIDRFLSKKRVSVSRLQLVGSVALFIAAKYEEINCPTLKDIVKISDRVYSEEEIIKAEKFMIDILQFDMAWPGPMSFLRRTSKADDYDFETRTLAKYLLETTVMDYRFVAALPSWLAAGAHFLARLLLNKGDWTPAHVYFSGYTSEQLMPLASYILECCRQPRTHHNAVYEKYQQGCFKKAAVFVQNWLRVVDQS